MSSSKVNVEGSILFEQPFVRVPYEGYRKVFRTSQKYIERELGAVQTSSSELLKLSKSEYDAATAVKSIDGMIGRVESLKRKLSDLHETSGTPTQQVMRERLNHLAELEAFPSRECPEFERWSDTRLDRWLVDWTLRNGLENTAKKIAEEKGIEKLVDIELFTEIHRIEDALRRHSCTDALAWCSENKTALRKMKSTLEFDLRLQEFIELARSRKTLDAINYSKKYLISWQDSQLHQIRHASALLAYPPTTTCGPYKRLYDSKRWTTLVQSFRLAVYQLNTLPTEPLLNLALYAGLASLKLPSCYDSSYKNVDCPVCDSYGLGQLASEVPWSHHVNSTIVCRLSGKIMNEDNPPMSFPNGYVYSKEALEELASKSKDGLVTCPHTGERCELRMLRKVFVS
ncbi:hypothetical protein BD410DRAFT_787966 [Rickenella mellea]|uniref:Macrophage erythroblast attacher n=1 Tax=Rickenella mellea TaxID=50990 RepID=A0A4Y7Q723_9AGAM|nr:hypothetical protein BD410DRAFT_787966 [Rickenella mellea]